MRLSTAVSAAVVVFRRPADLLPLYVLGVAVPAIVRVVPFLAAVIGYAYLSATGRLATVTDSLAGVDPPPDPADEAAFEAWLEGLAPALEPIATPTIGLLVVASILLSVVGLIVGYALVSAGQLATCDARLRNRRGLVAGVSGIRRYGPRMLALFLLEIVLWLVLAVVVGLPTLLLAAALGPLGLLLAFPAALLWLAGVLFVRAVFAFAPVAVVVDDAGVSGSIRATLGFVRRRPVHAGFYYVIAVGTLFATSTVSTLLAVFEVAAVGGLVSALVVLPALDLLKTALFQGYRERLAPPDPPGRSLRSQFVAGSRRGVVEMAAFVRRSPLAHVVAVGVGVVSFWLGWLLAEPFLGVVETSISDRLEGHLPPTAALEFFANNWLVSLTTALSGLAFAIPALASLWFNGLFLGFYGRTEVEPMELLAFVLPHGLFEIPAIFVSGALGLVLGGVAWRSVRGRADGDTVADALERAFWILVGVGVLLAIAAVVEGFVSPYYWRPFL